MPTPAKEAKRKKQGAAAIAALGKGGLFSKGSPGKVKVSESVSLADSATGKSSPVVRRVVRDAEDFSPSERAAKRESEKGPQLGATLAQIASAVPPGRSKVGAAISGGVSGAAIGATIGEAISASKRKKAKKDGQE